MMERNTERICCFTGHRDIPEEEYAGLFEKVENTLEYLIDNDFKCFKTGGAVGFDTIAALSVLEMKKRHPDIRLELVLPCPTQTDGWAEKDIEIYEDIKSKADSVLYTSEKYIRGCMHKRNRHLVKDSLVCVCYLKKNKGGTNYTVNYARQKKLMIIEIK